MIHTHYMTAERPATPKKHFQYNLLRVRVFTPRGRSAPLPEWICPGVIVHDATPRRVTPIDIRSPITEWE
jgi:hypothetical protein